MELTLEAYNRFLEAKMDIVEWGGWEVDIKDIHPSSYPHQKDTIRWAARIGRGLIAKSFGLGKTQDAIELAKLVVARTDGIFLIVAPLGVRHHFIHVDGPRLGTYWQYVTTDEDIMATDNKFLITNYERVRDGDIDPRLHNIAGVILDEGSVLRSLGSKTYDVFGEIFANVPYRWVATATPSPNNFREILGYADFLGVMDRGQALTRFFQRNVDKAGDLTLIPSQEENFWLWVASWALFIFKPSDLGYPDTGYDMPELNIYWHRVPISYNRDFGFDSWGQYRLFPDTGGGIQQAMREKRDTINSRICKMLEIMLQSFSEQTFNIGHQNDQDTATAQQGILRDQQGGIEAEKAGILPRNLQGQDRPREEKGVHAGVSQNLQEETKNAGTDRREKQKKAGEVCDRPGVQGEGETTGKGVQQAQSGNETEWSPQGGIWDNHRGIQCHPGETRGRVCDLRKERDGNKAKGEEGEGSLLRPQSRNGTGSGYPLPSLQLRDRSISGQPGITNESGQVPEQWIVWCHLNDEQRAIEKVLAQNGISFSSVHGSLSLDEAERRLFEWMDKKTTVLVAKPIMLGAGPNLQQCHNVIFLGLDYKFQDFIQAIHRTHRFGQKNQVQTHLIYAESEDDVVNILKRKWQQHDYLTDKMRRIVQQYGLTHWSIKTGLKRNIVKADDRIEQRGRMFTAVKSDCALELFRLVKMVEKGELTYV